MKGIFSAPAIREIDSRTIDLEPVSSIDLMERASRQFVACFQSHYPSPASLAVFCGGGNNGGDGLAIARMLHGSGYRVSVFLLDVGAVSPDFHINLNRLPNEIALVTLKDGQPIPVIDKDQIVIDAMFGSGIKRPVTGFPANVIESINMSAAKVVSVDLPSGLPVDGVFYEDGSTIRADRTISFQFPKLSFLLAENEAFVGDWEVIDIGLHPVAIEGAQPDFCFTEQSDFSGLFKPRGKFSHKGNFGHALLIAGSYGKAGAAILAARACLRSGVGLLTAHIPKPAYQAFQGAVPEAMVIPSRGKKEVDSKISIEPFSCIGIGPGLGKSENARKLLAGLLEESKVPMVMDADALNILSEEPVLMGKIPEGIVLTPHPKEFDRLVGKSGNTLERLEKARRFSKEKRVVLVLKGAYTAVIDQSGNVFFNGTGNPGMARGGSGDVLTGIITSFLAQGFSAIDAAKAGVYVHGMAGDIACRKFGETGMTISDLICLLPDVYKKMA